MKPINIAERFSRFDDRWSPKIIAELNGQHVKLAKLEGAFEWHRHPDEDELFFVVSGRLVIEFRDDEVALEPGEMVVVPRGVEHRPVAEGLVEVMLFEPAGTVNTGDRPSTRTVEARRL